MGSQQGIIKIKGRVGDFTFFKDGDTYSIRQKTGVEGSRVLDDPAFERTRENMSEFARAGQASKLIRRAILPEIKKVPDRRMTGRLTASFLRAIRADETNVRGVRNVHDGEVLLMKGFEFNGKTSLTESFMVPFTTLIDRATGNLTVDIPAFVPKNGVSKADGATHFQLTATSIEADFTEMKSVVKVAVAPPIKIGITEQPALTLTNNIPGSTKPLFLVLGIEFLLETNGLMYPLRNSGNNALSIVEVSDIV